MANRFVLRCLTRLTGDPNRAGPLRRWLAGLLLRWYPGQLTCTAFERFVIDYVEDSLDATTRRRFEFHLELCPLCQAYFRAYVRTMELGRRAFADPDASVPDDVPPDLVNAILAATLERR